MKAYIVPSMAYKPKEFLGFGQQVFTIFATVTIAENKYDALGMVLSEMRENFPEKDGWIHRIGMVSGNRTKEIKEIAEQL